ncbi:MAG TPA: SURF1 family protein [Ilumatobacteraceae bacterium]|jgi:cytochrome oxidase assembly protein ShyY1
MYRFLLRPKWILFHVAVLVAAVGMLGLARWQYNRLEQRNAFIDLVHGREAAEPQELTSLLGTTPLSQIEYARVTATGSYLTTGQMVDINQVEDGVNGSYILTPFQITGGPLIIVNRGFVEDRATIAPAPAGTLVIGGTARASEPHTTGELTDNNSSDKTLIRRVDLTEISKRIGSPVAPIFIDFIASKPTSTEPPIPVGLPDLSGGPPHLSYTIQWCIFSTCAVAGWVFAVRKSLKKRRKELAAAHTSDTTASVAAEARSDERGDDGSDTLSESPALPSA